MIYITNYYYLFFKIASEYTELNTKKNCKLMIKCFVFATDPNSIVYYDGEPNNSLQGK